MSDSGGHEIVIIRRNHDDEDEGHHGGVWKIAFADFMTAMMAFFLVMWLISANEKTRATIARYFNPIKLDEMTPNRKGIRDPKDVETKPAPDDENSGTGQSKETPPPNASQGNESQPSTAQSTSPPASKPTAGDQVQTPQTSSSGSSRASQNVSARSDNSPQVGSGSSSTGTRAQAGVDDSFRDPFAPSQEIGLQPAPVQPSALRTSTVLPKPDASTVAPSNRSLIVDEPIPPSASPQPLAKTSDAQPLSSAQPATPTLPSAPSLSAQVEANQLRTVIASALKDNLSTRPGPALEVKATSEGTLISLMDEASFEMFAVGSARPQAKVSAMMQKVAQILKSHPGRIVIRGHTDGRVYKSDTYDNWRLSADRADMARNMLITGGFDEKRVERIEGLADRQLKKPDDPNAPENRRIEILLEDAKP